MNETTLPLGMDDAAAADARPVIVAGVMPGQARAVSRVALRTARSMGARLLFGYVQRSSALIEQVDPQERDLRSLSPDLDEESELIAASLRAQLSEDPAAPEADWAVLVLGGDPVRALSRLAEERGAAMIVMGGVRRGFAHRAEDLISGSPATWLARNQQRPVLVVPDDGGPRLS